METYLWLPTYVVTYVVNVIQVIVEFLLFYDEIYRQCVYHKITKWIKFEFYIGAKCAAAMKI